EVRMHLDVREVVIVEAGAPELRVRQVEPQGLDEVQHAAGDRRQPDRVARVRRDLGLVEDDVEHSDSDYSSSPVTSPWIRRRSSSRAPMRIQWSPDGASTVYGRVSAG